MNASKVWYITGASQGLGLILVKKLLKHGYRVAATSRTVEGLLQRVGIYDQTQFLPLSVDITSSVAIQHSVQLTLEAFGRIDVVVNNAGYGMAGTLEDIEEEKVRHIFDVNVMATINVTKSFLPVMREQRLGYFINIASVAGLVGAPGWSIYSATKAAVIAFSEVLAADVKEFGIKVSVIEPSGFRTGFLTKDSLAFTEVKTEGYNAVKETQQRYLATSGRQAGDPEKAAEIFIKLAEEPAPPLHLLLGADAFKRAAQKVATLAEEMEQWKITTVEADFK